MLAMAGNGVQLEEDRGRPHHQKLSAVSFQNGHHHRRLESGPAGGGGGGRGGGRVGGGGGEGERGRRGGGGGRGGARGESHSHYILGRVISTTTTTTTSRERARRVLGRALPASASVLGLAGVFWVMGTLLWGRRRYRIQPTDSPAFWGFQSRGPVTADSNRCADLDMSLFDKAMVCGWPLSSPCFQHFRCTPKVEGEGAGGGEGGEEGGSRGVGMYVYDSECSLADSEMLSVDGLDRNGEKLGHHEVAWYWRKALKDAGLLAATYDAACMFIHVSWVGVEPCAAKAPLWNGGANHVMVDFSDKSRDNRLAVVDSFAMEAASNMHTCFYRTGYDIAMPLAPKMVFHYLAGVAPLERKYFLTFKGSLYLNRHGSEERVSLRPLHDEPNGVITALSCFELHNKHLLEENIEYCESLKHRYDSFHYDKLMNTTFGLVPGGRSPGTYRLAEVMSAGAIPVFVARDIIQPFREQYDWPSFSFSFAPTDVWSSLVKTLRAVSPEQLEEMQHKSLEAYWEIFGGKEQDFVPIARKMVEVLQQRIGHRG